MKPYLVVVTFVLTSFIVGPAFANMSNILAPVGSPQFTESITQSGWAPVTSWSQYVGVRVVAPGDAFIEKVTGLASAVAGTEQLNANGRLVEAWWTNAAPSSFSATYELGSLLGKAAAQDPESYRGLRVETALAGANGRITVSRSWVFTDGYSPAEVLGQSGNWLPISIRGWYLTDLALDGSNWHGGLLAGSPRPPVVPAPGAVLLGLIGFGLIGWVRREAA